MVAPTLGAYTVASRSTNGTTLAITVPTFAAGDTLYIAYADDGDAGTPSIDGTGWTAVVDNYTIPASGVADSGSFSLWKKAASGTTYTATNTVSERAVMVAFIVQNDGGINVGPVSANGTTSSPAVGDLTTTVANCLRISIVADSTDRTPIGTFGGHTLLVTQAASSAGTISVQSKTLTSSGTDTGVSTTQASTDWTTHTFAIAPTSSANALTASAITTGAPVLGTPTLAQVHVLAASAIATGTPTVAAATIGQKHALTATGIATGAPTLATTTIAQKPP